MADRDRVVRETAGYGATTTTRAAATLNATSMTTATISTIRVPLGDGDLTRVPEKEPVESRR